MHDYDKSSKWLIQHHGGSILRLGGLTGITAWRPLQAEVVQPRRLPDGLLEVRFEQQIDAELYVIEIYTYADLRNLSEIADDVLFVYMDRKVLLEVLTLVLQRRGNVSLAGPHEIRSRRGWTQLRTNWRVVELWTLPAEELLALNDVGLVPWVPLTRFDGPPEVVLEKCRDQIDQLARTEQKANLLAVAQVLTRLRYNDQGLLSIFGGSKAMIESPLIQELMAKTRHDDIITVLEARFGVVPRDLVLALRDCIDDERLRKLNRQAAICEDLEAFRTILFL